MLNPEGLLLPGRNHPQEPPIDLGPRRTRTCKEGQKLTAGPFNPEGQGDGGQLLDAVEAKLMTEREKEGRMLASPDLRESDTSGPSQPLEALLSMCGVLSNNLASLPSHSVTLGH